MKDPKEAGECVSALRKFMKLAADQIEDRERLQAQHCIDELDTFFGVFKDDDATPEHKKNKKDKDKGIGSYAEALSVLAQGTPSASSSSAAPRRQHLHQLPPLQRARAGLTPGLSRRVRTVWASPSWATSGTHSGSSHRAASAAQNGTHNPSRQRPPLTSHRRRRPMRRSPTSRQGGRDVRIAGVVVVMVMMVVRRTRWTSCSTPARAQALRRAAMCRTPTRRRQKSTSTLATPLAPPRHPSHCHLQTRSQLVVSLERASPLSVARARPPRQVGGVTASSICRTARVHRPALPPQCTATCPRGHLASCISKRGVRQHRQRRRAPPPVSAV